METEHNLDKKDSSKKETNDKVNDPTSTHGTGSLPRTRRQFLRKAQVRPTRY
jgi:hypothetical protein